VQSLLQELDVAKRLQLLSTQLMKPEKLGALYEQVLDTALSVLQADFAAIQRLEADREGKPFLRMVGNRGLVRQASDSWQVVTS
jgi:hypothetical protein